MSLLVKPMMYREFFAAGYAASFFFEDPQICEYFFAYLEGEDRSRVVYFKGQPILFLPAIFKNGEYSFAGLPIRPHFLNLEDKHARIQALEEVLNELMAESGTKMIAHFSPEFAPLALKYGCSIRSRLSSSIDLSASEEEIRRGLRSSYKSLINKGQRELQTRVDYGSDCPANAMKEAQQFHFEVSGRKTRSDRTWEIQQELIQEKKAFHIASSVDGKLAASSYVFTDGKEAYYGSGVYNRELMREGKPLSHWNVYKAIIFAKSLGIRKFILGDVGPDFQDEKNEDIAMFKRGFGGRIDLDATLVITK